MDLTGKKLLVLAGSGLHLKVVRAAKEMGIYTIVTDFLNLEDSPAKAEADEAWMYSTSDVDAIVEKCKEEKIDGVLNFCIDTAQRPYQQICDKLGLPCFASEKQLNILTDKRKFKDYCIDHNVDVIPEYTEADVLSDQVEYPIFIKPTNSSGSKGQAICYTKAEAISALEKNRKNPLYEDVIIEKFMGGHQDIATAFFVVDSEPYLVKFADRHLGRHEDNMDKQVMCTELPSSFAPVFMDNVHDRVTAMIKSLGIKFGPVFMQGFVDGNTIRYYDPAQRMPGGDYDLVLKKATGFDTVRSMIVFALTGDITARFGDPKDSYLLNGGTALLLTVAARPGKMARVAGFDQVLQYPAVVYGRQIVSEGSEIPDTGDIKQRVAAFGVYLENKDQIDDFIHFFYNTYTITDENGKDMIVYRYKYRG